MKRTLSNTNKHNSAGKKMKATSLLSERSSTVTPATTFTGWYKLPSDWFGHAGGYLNAKEFYRTIRCCRAWHVNEQRIAPLAFTLTLNNEQTLLGELVGVSQRPRHVRTIKTLTRVSDYSSERVSLDQHAIKSLYYHFPSVTQLECAIEIDRLKTNILSKHSFLSLRSLNLRMTLDQKVGTGSEKEIDWWMIPPLLSHFIRSHRRTLTSITLDWDLWGEEANYMREWGLETLSELATPTQLTYLAITIGQRCFFESHHRWEAETIELIRSFTHLTELTLPQFRAVDIPKLFARPIPWHQLTTLHTQGGSHELEQYLKKTKKQIGWPRIMPIFKHQPLNNSMAPQQQAQEDGEEGEEKAEDEGEGGEGDEEAQSAGAWRSPFPVKGEVHFPDGWANE